jgi:hypothetical protein
MEIAGVALAVAIGVLLISGAFTAGRVASPHAPWPVLMYWGGQLLILVPAVTYLLRRAVSARGTIAVVTVFTVAEYLVKVCYSPRSFTFPDELIHWRATVDLLHTGQLFTVNHALPVAAHYPGLEEVTASVVSVTGLPLYTAGLIVIGVAHLSFVLALFVLFRSMGGSHRLAGIAVVLYATNSHFQSFDSMYIYQSLALPLLAIALVAAHRLSRRVGVVPGFGWTAVGLLCIAGTVVTHHVTSYALASLLLLITLCLYLKGGHRYAWKPGILALGAVTLVLVWLFVVAPDTFNYLRPTINNFFSAISGQKAKPGNTTTGLSGPFADRVLSAASVLIFAALIPLGWLDVWRKRRDDAWVVAMAIGALGWFVAIAIRVFVPNGTELAGRASTFSYIPAAFVAALGLATALQVTRSARISRRAIGIAVVTLLLCNALANGWPPYWERLPGDYLPAAFERSVDPAGIAASRWALIHLGPGHQFATDMGNATLLANYGKQNVARNVAPLFTASSLDETGIKLAREQSLEYLLVDRRLSKALPPEGSYFTADPNTGRYTSPIPLRKLDKFDHIAGIHRIYDNGDIVIYDLRGSRYAP